MFCKILNFIKKSICKEKITNYYQVAKPTLKSGVFLLLWMAFLVILEFSVMFFAKAKSFWNPFMQALPHYMLWASVPFLFGRIVAKIWIAVAIPFISLVVFISVFMAAKFNLAFPEMRFLSFLHRVLKK